jgi:uncharacterized damage-inducible protein DinB
MPVPAVVAAAADNYRFNSEFLTNSVKDLSAEDWFKRPAANLNHIAWIVGHVVWARQLLIQRLGAQWEQPGLDVFARGVKLQEDSAYPSREELLKALEESHTALAGALDRVPAELLAKEVSQGPPSADGKVSGVVNFLALHETYHVGQAAYLRSWLGHPALMG